MTILESLTAIAKARPDLVTEITNGFGVGDGLYEPKTSIAAGVPVTRARLLLWAFETAAREGISLTLVLDPNGYSAVHDDVYAIQEWHVEDVPCPTEAAMAALAAALTTNERVAT